jgi:nucleoside-diphosphate-sugar epimerase
VIYFVTGLTGAVVPIIVEDLIRKDPDAFFYFGLRPDGAGNHVASRFDALVASLELADGEKDALRAHSRLVKIDVERERLGIEPGLYEELVARVEKILHGAADVRFDQPYETIRVSNVVFTEKIYALYSAMRDRRASTVASAPTLYYLSTAYVYGAHPEPIPEDYPDFRPRRPDNTYAQTKAEAKHFVLDKIKRLDDRIVIFEPTIIGGASTTGRTRAYHLHYLLMLLGYLGRLPFLAAPGNTLDIVPVDWVAAIVSDVMTRGGFRQGVLRMASGRDAVSVGTLYDAGLAYYRAHDPMPDHHVRNIRFVPSWCLPPMVALAKRFYRALHALTRNPRHRKRVRQIGLLEGYLPYIVERKVFENARSTELIRKHTGCGEAPRLQDIFDAEGRLVEKGYYEKILADTLRTGWGGLVDFERRR